MKGLVSLEKRAHLSLQVLCLAAFCSSWVSSGFLTGNLGFKLYLLCCLLVKEGIANCTKEMEKAALWAQLAGALPQLCCDINRLSLRYILALVPNLILEGTLGCRS